ncbi:hypothetical protein [Methanocalculus natronophilus]|uniref:hypothetical protein n=1 Tax=Methanocalculus natronophilus TaxID=1262400 RepID=UPI0031B57749
MLRLKSLACTSCGASLSAKKRDLALACPKCEKIMEFDTGNLNDLVTRVAGFGTEKGGEKIYIPFWVVDADLNVTDKKVIGGRIGRFFKGQKQLSGQMKFWICAADIENDQRKEWNMEYTLKQPSFTEQNGFQRVDRLPVVMNREDAAQAAEFLFLRHEVEISGTLQSLTYDFTVHGKELIYLPFYKSNAKYMSGL